MEYVFDFAFLPSEHLKEHDCRIVVDLLRASSQIVAFFDCGGKILLPVSEVREAFALKEALGPEWKIMGERKGLIVPGFDYGNSPLELARAGAPERAVITTSNGSKAIRRAADGCGSVLVGCARNAGSAAWKALRSGRRIGVVASGRNGEFSIEDTACAGMIIEKMLKLAPKNGGTKMELTDGAIAALALWHALGPDILDICMDSEHGRILRGLGFTDDVEFCSVADVTETVPGATMYNGALSLTAD